MSTIMRKVNILSRAESVYRNDRLNGTALNACHHGYILAVIHNPGMTQDELARHLCINKSNVTRQLAHLEEHGYVERRPDTADRRSMRVFPTEKAEAVYPEVADIVKRWDAFLKSAFTEEEAALLDGLLERAAERAGEFMERRDSIEDLDQIP